MRVWCAALGYALSSQSNTRQADLEDFVQDALLKILAALDTFRGESLFTTWAQNIAVRVGLTGFAPAALEGCLAAQDRRGGGGLLRSQCAGG